MSQDKVPSANKPLRTPDKQPLPIDSSHPIIHNLVQYDLSKRLRVGIETYGKPLRAHNGRDALRDAYEEALDLACYLRQALYERNGR